MSSVGTGYDLSASTFSPDGRVFQINYALKAVENSSTSVALRVKDGVILGAEKLVISKMISPESGRRVHMVDHGIGVAISGFVADARQLVARCQEEAFSYRDIFGSTIPVRVLAQRMANYMQVYTLYSYVRPFGASILIAGVDEENHQPQVFQVEPTGITVGCFGAAIGKGRQSAKTEMEKLDLANLTCEEAVKELAKIIHTIHDDIKDKNFILELGWVSPQSNYKYERVPRELVAQAEKAAKEALGDLSDMEEEDI